MSSTRDWVAPATRPSSSRAARATLVRISLADRSALLGAQPLFAGLGRRQIAGLARVTETAHFPAGQELVTEGTSGDFCFLLVEGDAEVVKGGVAVAKLGPGELFGELALLDPGPRSATVRTVSEVVAIRLTRGALDEAIRADPRIALRLLAVLARRIRLTTAELH